MRTCAIVRGRSSGSSDTRSHSSIVLTIFSDRLGQLTVAFGVAGAGYSADFPFLWDEIQIPIKYGTDWRLARQILLDITQEIAGEYPESAAAHWSAMVRQYRLEDAGVEPMVTLLANDNWIEFTVRYVVDYKRRRTVKDRLFTRILEEFDRTEGKVAMASATFHLVEAPTLNVRLQDQRAEAPS
jgi:small-conductance mechanosensitive channel